MENWHKLLSTILMVLLARSLAQDGAKSKPSETDKIVATSGGGGRWTFPSECKDGCRFIRWKSFSWNGEKWIEFNIRGMSRGYIAVAISTDEGMGDDDAYLCAVTHPGAVDIRVISAHLVGFTRPESNGLVSPAHVVDTFIYDDIMNCVFNRPLSVTKTVNGRNVTWDLTSQDFNLLYAEGDVDRRGNVRYHKFRTHTHARFDLSSNFSYPRLDETEAVGELQIHLKKRMSTVAPVSGYEATTAEFERVLAPEGRLVAIVICLCMGSVVLYFIYKRSSA